MARRQDCQVRLPGKARVWTDGDQPQVQLWKRLAEVRTARTGDTPPACPELARLSRLGQTVPTWPDCPDLARLSRLGQTVPTWPDCPDLARLSRLRPKSSNCVAAAYALT